MGQCQQQMQTQSQHNLSSQSDYIHSAGNREKGSS